ncbi:hypothetical protein SteCoe_8121 [Stentor coeruleus]|uniref:PLD phosphodiesterase domain-containing protein n=1 Tax=Stentor coeruleus TaxID=5963 RepID=A0A1R2CKY2_9CILI|nr:hypothetical protein SteCoe_8121 [Stentor coeruleus]
MGDIEFINSGDLFFERLWNMIDRSKTNCWILTYHMAESYIADETIRRLINAAERGVDVVLYVDWLNFYPSKHLIEKLRLQGGKVETLNDMNIYTRYINNFGVFTKNIFKRYHEKLCVIDNQVTVGSANFDIEYGQLLFGNDKFYDLNIILTKKCITDAQNLFLEIAGRYNYKLTPHQMEEIEDNKLDLLSCEPYYFRHDIQEYLLYKINRATKRIILAQGYYYNIKKVQKALKRAAKRGVQIELLTTRYRDQMAYKDLSNAKITKNLIKIGASIYEMSDRILHSKAYIIDDDIIAGSFNNDKWSWSMNSELSLLCTDKKFTHLAMDIIDDIKQNSLDIKLNNTKFVAGAYAWFWKWFLNTSEIMMNTKKNYKYFLLNAYVYDESNPIEERFALRMQRIKNFSVKISTLSNLLCS